MASGSEVSLCFHVKNILQQHQLKIKIISIASFDILTQQKQSYIKSILPDKDKLRVAIELSNDTIWYKYLRIQDMLININCFGKSGKLNDIINYFNFTPQKIAKKIIQKFYKIYK